MGFMEEDKKGQKELDNLEEFLSKYYAVSLTMNNISQLDVCLNIVRIKCHGIAITKDEIA